MVLTCGRRDREMMGREAVTPSLGLSTMSSLHLTTVPTLEEIGRACLFQEALLSDCNEVDFCLSLKVP